MSPHFSSSSIFFAELLFEIWAKCCHCSAKIKKEEIWRSEASCKIPFFEHSRQNIVVRKIFLNLIPANFVLAHFGGLENARAGWGYVGDLKKAYHGTEVTPFCQQRFCLGTEIEDLGCWYYDPPPYFAMHAEVGDKIMPGSRGGFRNYPDIYARGSQFRPRL